MKAHFIMHDRTIQDLMDHANRMWDAEVINNGRYENRGRQIVLSTTAMLGFVSAVAIIARPGEGVSDARFYTQALSVAFFAVGFFAICWGLWKLIAASKFYLMHAEEDFGSLPNPLDFGDISGRWWITQPTIDTVEERYLLALSVRRLTWVHLGWRIPGSRFASKRPLLGTFWSFAQRNSMRVVRQFAEIRVIRARDRLTAAFRENTSGLRKAQKEYRNLLRYGPDLHNTDLYEPKRNRGPRDMASMMLAIKLIHERRKRREASAIEILDTVLKWAQQVSDDLEKENEISNFLPNEIQISDYNTDLLHPSTMVVASSYYMQFAESFGWNFGGRSSGVKTDNPTGSGRAYSSLDIESLPEAMRTTTAEIGWRPFVSVYFAAQNLRSHNWNLWFRVKRSERIFVRGFIMIFVAFVCIAIGQWLLRSDSPSRLAPWIGLPDIDAAIAVLNAIRSLNLAY